MTDANHPDHYHTLARPATAETKVKGSRFRAEVHPAVDEAVARARLQEIRKRDHDATHHCSAWRVGPPELNAERFDDDGEPSGSAGRPLLQVLSGADLYEVVVVVTRWFGGTKLGCGGLARAYTEAAALALDAAARRRVYREVDLLLRSDYDHIGAIEALLGRHSDLVREVERHFEDHAELRVRVLESHAARMLDLFREATGGKVLCESRPVGRQ